MDDDTKQWMTFYDLQERNRCIKCKNRLDEFVMCERCLEFKYCSIHCLEDDRETHLKYCNVIGLRKGRLTRLTDEQGQLFGKLKEKAKILNEDGTLRIPGTSFREAKQQGKNSGEEEDDAKTEMGGMTPNPKTNKKKHGKLEHKKNKDNNSNGSEGKEQTEKFSEEKPVKSLLAGGQFGGAVTADQKVQSGESFGKGWWSARTTELNTDQASTDSTSANLGDNADKPSGPNENHSAASLPTAASPTEMPLEEALSGLEVAKYDPKQAKERAGNTQSSSTRGKCFLCDKEGPVLKCSRCKIANYCDKNCQKNDYKKHKDVCKLKEKFDNALSKVPQALKIADILFRGSFDVSPFLEALPDEFTYMLGSRCHVMVEIVDEHPHPFRYGAIVRDLMGHATQVLFYTDPPIYIHRGSGMFRLPLPIHLSLCIKPGNFMLLLDAHWHYFLDGTRGIRIDDMKNVYFILN